MEGCQVIAFSILHVYPLETKYPEKGDEREGALRDGSNLTERNFKAPGVTSVNQLVTVNEEKADVFIGLKAFENGVRPAAYADEKSSGFFPTGYIRPFKGQAP